MNHLAVFLSIAIFTGVLIFFGDAFAQTTPYPQQQRTKTGAPATTTLSKTQSAPTVPRQTQSAPTGLGKAQTVKTQTRTSQSQFHQANKEHGHGYSHGGGGVGVGIGATVDLSGIGQRRAEPDPFAVPAERQPVGARTEEKPKTPKKPREIAKTDPFAGLQLIGRKAKEEAASNAASPTAALRALPRLPKATPTTDTSPDTRPCAMLLVTMYRTPGPGITASTRLAKRNARNDDENIGNGAKEHLLIRAQCTVEARNLANRYPNEDTLEN